MKITIAGVLLSMALIFGGDPAQAQALGGSRTFVGPGGPASLTPSYPSQPWSVYSAPAASTTFHYSYYAAPGLPAREYVGPAQYPFYGRPYGHPSDYWSWGYLSGNNRATLTRYYYPPVR